LPVALSQICPKKFPDVAFPNFQDPEIKAVQVTLDTYRKRDHSLSENNRLQLNHNKGISKKELTFRELMDKKFGQIEFSCWQP